MVASGKAIFMGAGAIVNRAVDRIQLASVRLNESEAKIEVYAAWRKDDASPALRCFLECARSKLTVQKKKAQVAVGKVRNSHFPQTASR